tara:strand:- start:830 stop:1198 length:369 start_codon:yes stop_codon:yes gene_type:complete
VAIEIYAESKENNTITEMENQYPIMTKRFKELQEFQYALFCRKQKDYGSQNISVGTKLETDEEVQLSLTGIWFRMHDKIQRAKNLIMRNDNAVEDEPLEDAFLDMSNYGIMAALVKEQVWGK